MKYPDGRFYAQPCLYDFFVEDIPELGNWLREWFGVKSKCLRTPLKVSTLVFTDTLNPLQPVDAENGLSLVSLVCSKKKQNIKHS